MVVCMIFFLLDDKRNKEYVSEVFTYQISLFMLVMRFSTLVKGMQTPAVKEGECLSFTHFTAPVFVDFQII